MTGQETWFFTLFVLFHYNKIHPCHFVCSQNPILLATTLFYFVNVCRNAFILKYKIDNIIFSCHKSNGRQILWLMTNLISSTTFLLKIQREKLLLSIVKKYILFIRRAHCMFISNSYHFSVNLHHQYELYLRSPLLDADLLRRSRMERHATSGTTSQNDTCILAWMREKSLLFFTLCF